MKIDKLLLAVMLLFSAIIVALIVLFFVNQDIFTFTVLTLLPISELRGSIPLALLNFKWSILFVYPLAVFLNATVSPLVFLFLDHIHPLFYKWNFYKKLFDKFITRARKKMKKNVDKFGMVGIMLFVGIPLPITGAYTGTAGAWILGLNRKKTMIAALCGVMISGLIVTSIIVLIMQFNMPSWLNNILEFFIKVPETTIEGK